MTGKSQLTGNDFCQFYRDFQGHKVGIGVGVELAFAHHLANNQCTPAGYYHPEIEKFHLVSKILSKSYKIAPTTDQ